MARRPHFLVVTFPLQGHINPAVRLAKRLAAADADALVTFSTAAAAHRRMFPEFDGPDAVAPSDHDGRLTFAPFNDGTKNGYVRSTHPSAFNDYMAVFHEAGARSVSDLIDGLAVRGRPVSCVVYTILLPWAADVAGARGIQSALYWIQPVAVLATYYHFFHGYSGVVEDHRQDPSFVVQFPGLPSQEVGDLPSFLTDSNDPADFFHSVYTTLRELFETLDKEKAKTTILVNTCQELETGTLAAVDAYNILPIGPVLPCGNDAGLFEQDESKYMEWLDSKTAKSVVYVSFGSLTTMERAQLEELFRGLEATERSYLCVVRKDNKGELAQLEVAPENGMLVEWCDQVRVLSHAAVGCFVTHCGWNSVLESVACGVPMITVPRMSDQRMNARLVEDAWRVGARVERDGGGVLRGEELRRCVEKVMNLGEAAAAEMGRTAKAWKQAVAEALGEGGSSDRNLMAFVHGARRVASEE